jgi:hypothetical protein
MNTDDISVVSVKGYNKSTKMYKFVITITQNKVDTEHKITCSWNDVKLGFMKIKKEVNKTIYAKLLFDLEGNVLIKDKNFNSVKKFIKGIPLKNLERKIYDIQCFFDKIMEYKRNSDNMNKSAIKCFLENAFSILN